MMLKMSGPGKNFRFADAAAACLLILAVVAGPMCLGLCTGSSCVGPAKIAHNEAACHGMSGKSAAHFTAKGASGCGEANIVVSSKPNFSVKSGPAASDEDIPAAVAANLANVFGDDANGFSSGGPPHRIQVTNSKTLVLRI